MTNKRGGTRPGAGHPFNTIPSHRIVIHATDDELATIMALSPRERTERMTTMTHKTYTPDDLYDMFANQASPQAIAETSTNALALDLEELDTDGAITDYTAAAEQIKAIARSISK